MFTKTVCVAAFVGALSSSAAFAATEASAWTDLNLRAGPGPMYEIVGVSPANASVSVEGCLDAASWCKVSFEGKEGWASGDYLTAMVDSTPTVVYANREKVAVGSVTYEDQSKEGAAVGVATGAAAGAMVAGPVGALVGAVLGGGLGANVPDKKVTTYVTGTPVEPVYLDGDVVVGAGLPETVVLSEVPDSEYSYAYVNGVPVIVERKQRQIVYIVR